LALVTFSTPGAGFVIIERPLHDDSGVKRTHHSGNCIKSYAIVNTKPCNHEDGRLPKAPIFYTTTNPPPLEN